MWGLSISLVFVNVIFLSLGALLYIFSTQNGIAIPEKADMLFPLLALNHLSPIVGIFFILGLVAAAYSSADSALTALITSFCVHFLGLDKKAFDLQISREHINPAHRLIRIANYYFPHCKWSFFPLPFLPIIEFNLIAYVQLNKSDFKI